MGFSAVFTSPLQRARRTCELAGFDARATVDADLVEWDYGEYEGRRTADILVDHPTWRLFEDGCPNGESAAMSERAPTVSSTDCVVAPETCFCSGTAICCE
jgi:probable phosphoglycerate mutase